jgi:ABC-type uncharacterized transport system substrate-binding protein
MGIEVGIIMGSKSDFPIMEQAKTILEEMGISVEVRVVSAHRTPEYMVDYAKNAAARGIKVIIAGAGGAAHLPGMVASMSPLPVIVTVCVTVCESSGCHPLINSNCSLVIDSMGKSYLVMDAVFFQMYLKKEYKACPVTPVPADARFPAPLK